MYRIFIFTAPSPFRRVQIYRKVTSQILPSALDRVQNVRARDFIRGCLAPDPDDRPSAMDLLNLPFLKDKNEDEVRMRHWTVCAVILTKYAVKRRAHRISMYSSTGPCIVPV